ncbi:MAG: hypothetical protein Q8918_17725 [Bacteroidota bacterium]|nr:hypothetical protein [Bacteroidota bacterium]
MKMVRAIALFILTVLTLAMLWFAVGCSPSLDKKDLVGNWINRRKTDSIKATFLESNRFIQDDNYSGDTATYSLETIGKESYLQIRREQKDTARYFFRISKPNVNEIRLLLFKTAKYSSRSKQWSEELYPHADTIVYKKGVVD